MRHKHMVSDFGPFVGLDDVRRGLDGLGAGRWRTVVPVPVSIFKHLLGRQQLELMAVFICAANGKYAKSIKTALWLAGGVGFTYRPCSAYGYVEGEGYIGGQQVSYEGWVAIGSVLVEK